jgi:hypothetical protein
LGGNQGPFEKTDFDLFPLVVNPGRVGCNRRVMDDDELIASLAGGDDTALRELFARHAPWLAARLRKALSSHDVEDVLQETFLAVWKNAKTYRPGYLGFAEYALIEAWRNPWTWPARPPTDRGAWICASLVFAVGLLACTVCGARTRLANDG